MRTFCLIFLALGIIIVSGRDTTRAAVRTETVRIAIQRNATQLTVDGEGLLVMGDGRLPVVLTPPVTVRPGPDGIAVNGATYGKLSFTGPAFVLVNGKPYRGTIEVMSSDKGVLVVNELQLEDYLVGLINCEISSAWPIEAVKAQAVIARSYALNRKEARRSAPYHMESSVIDQVYDGSLVEDSRARRAVSETEGEVLTFGNSIIQAFYHSNCGGRTEAADNVWGTAVPYLKGVDCQYCLVSPSSAWNLKLTLREVEEKLKAAGYRAAGVTELKTGPRNSRGRLKSIIAVTPRGEIPIPGDAFRKAVGYATIKSTNFSIRSANGDIFFSGLGNGHGVGLCQWGGKQRALEGFGYTEILSYYYPGTELKKLSDIR